MVPVNALNVENAAAEGITQNLTDLGNKVIYFYSGAWIVFSF